VKGSQMKSRSLFIVFAAAVALVIVGLTINSNAQQKSASKAAAAAPPASIKTDGVFATDFTAALASAKKDKRPVFVDFYTDWCGWCKKMDQESYTDPGIQKQIKDGWVAMKINAEDDSKKGVFNGKSMSHREIAQYFRVSGYPSFLFIDKEGKPVTVLPGYFPKADFALVLKYFKDELYTKKVELDRYIEKNK
jgi:thioredoxin-related protein